MVAIKKLVLDVLKPHHPNALEFCSSIAEVGDDYTVNTTVLGVDENTESVQITIEGSAIDFDAIQTAINTLGGSLHSIDKVEVRSTSGSN